MKITNTHITKDGCMVLTITPTAPDNIEMHKAMTKLRMSVVRVAQQAGVSLASIGFTLERPAYEDLIRNARTNDTGWNALCANTINRIEEMQTEITTLKQMNRGLHADLTGMVAQQEEQERVRTRDHSGARNVPAPASIAELHDRIRKHVEAVREHYHITDDAIWRALDDATKIRMTADYDFIQLKCNPCTASR